MRILITAPYMIRDRARVAPLLSRYPWDIAWAEVKERLEADALGALIRDVDGIICGDDRFTPHVYDQAKRLKVVVKWGTGVDSLQVDEAQKRQIRVCRTPDAFTDPVADSTLAYILAHCRGIISNDAVLRRGGWDKIQGYALFEKTIGILGFGAIGSAVAKRLQAFGATILAHDIVPREMGGVRMVSKEELFTHSDFITLHCDLNHTSRHLINRQAFRQMAKCPYLINTARGPLIHEESLIEALDQQQIVGAALDVFEQEPLCVRSPLRQDPRVLLASHNSNSSPVCWDRVHQRSISMLHEALYGCR